MAVQSLLSESVFGWSIFTFILLAILAFCWVYIRKFQSRQESEVVSTITAICALAIALITSALLPVDIFLVSFMKYPNGTYKEWAANNETRVQIEDTVLYGYYKLGIISAFVEHSIRHLGFILPDEALLPDGGRAGPVPIDYFVNPLFVWLQQNPDYLADTFST